jgi:hypothetical protein
MPLWERGPAVITRGLGSTMYQPAMMISITLGGGYADAATW